MQFGKLHRATSFTILMAAQVAAIVFLCIFALTCNGHGAAESNIKFNYTTKISDGAYTCLESVVSLPGNVIEFCSIEDTTMLLPSNAWMEFTCTCNVSMWYADKCGCPNYCMNNIHANDVRGTCKGNFISNNNNNNNLVSKCQCENGWQGEDCSLVSCPLNKCSNRGRCIPATAATNTSQAVVVVDRCECEPGFQSGALACVVPQQQQVPPLLPLGQLVPGTQYAGSDPYGDDHPVFNKSRIATIHITVDETEFKQLLDIRYIKEVGPIRANFSFDNGIVSEHLYDIAMDIKGQASSVRMEKGFSFTFNKYKPHKKRLFYNLSVLSVKTNMHDDATLQRMVLPLEVTRSLNLPSPRASFVVLFINMRMYGVQVMEEEVNYEFLQSRYKNPDGPLFKMTSKGNFENLGSDVNVYKNFRTGFACLRPRHVYALDSAVGYGNDTELAWTSDFMKLINAFNTSSPTVFAQVISQYLDFDSVAKALAVNQVVGNFDGMMKGNNFYLYKNPLNDNKFEAILHGFIYPWSSASSTLNNLYTCCGSTNSQWPKLLTIPVFKKLFDYYAALLADKVLSPMNILPRMDWYLTMLTSVLASDRSYALAPGRDVRTFKSETHDLISFTQIRNVMVKQFLSQQK